MIGQDLTRYLSTKGSYIRIARQSFSPTIFFQRKCPLARDFELIRGIFYALSLILRKQYWITRFQVLRGVRRLWFRITPHNLLEISSR
jgi:hypothetical protein